MSSSVFQNVRNWTSSTVVVLNVRQHLRPLWVFAVDVRLMVILWCNPAYLRRIKSAFLSPVRFMQQLCLESLASTSREFSAKRRLCSLLSSWLCHQEWLSCTLAVVFPQILWTFLSVACTLHVFCTREGWAPTHCRCMGCAGRGDQSFHEFPPSTKML